MRISDSGHGDRLFRRRDRRFRHHDRGFRRDRLDAGPAPSSVASCDALRFPPLEAFSMAATRLLMRKLRDILRLKYEAGLSHRAIARACSIGVSTVSVHLQRAITAGLRGALPAGLGGAALEARLFASPDVVPTGPRPR